MEVIYLPKADEDLEFWIATGNKAILKRIALLTEAIIQNPYYGVGKPEALKHQMTGKWSRRITEEHRYVYEIENNTHISIFAEGELLKLRKLLLSVFLVLI